MTDWNNINWRILARLPEAELARLDIAAVNLVCARGLPGSERIDLLGCLRTLDAWAGLVRRWTEAGYTEFFLPNPGEFRNSEAYFRIAALVSVLQRHCKVRYDPSKIGAGPEVPFEFDEQFVHGVIQGPGGTCATLPIAYAAVGRRLGYPIKLVCTKRHAFCRWDDRRTGEKLNIEGAGDGFSVFPDHHYRKWPIPIESEEEEKAHGYLKSWSPRQELANFVSQRAWVLRDHRRFREAIETFVVASQLDAEHATYPGCIVGVIQDWKEHLQGRLPPHFPRFEILARRDRRRWPSVPWEIEREAYVLESVEDCLDDPRSNELWWQPLREGRPPVDKGPDSITANYIKVTHI